MRFLNVICGPADLAKPASRMGFSRHKNRAQSLPVGSALILPLWAAYAARLGRKKEGPLRSGGRTLVSKIGRRFGCSAVVTGRQFCNDFNVNCNVF